MASVHQEAGGSERGCGVVLVEMGTSTCGGEGRERVSAGWFKLEKRGDLLLCI